MAKVDDSWKVGEHGALEPLAENVWRVEGGLPGISLRRTMTVAKRDDGGLVIHSAIALDDARMEELSRLGKLAYLIVPNGFHRLDAPRFKKRHPELKVLAPAGSRKRIEKVIACDGTLDDFPPDGSVRFEKLDGINDAERAMIVRSKDGVTLVLNDCVFDMDVKKDFMGRLVNGLLGAQGGPRVSRLFRLAVVKDKKALRAQLERYAALPDLARLIVSHEKLNRGADAVNALKTAATFL